MPLHKPFSLIELTDQYMTREKPIDENREPHLYPSESSVAWTDAHDIKKVSGGCLRKSFFRYNKIQPLQKPDAYAQWIFAMGKAAEEILIEQYRGMDLLVDNNIKFRNPEYNLSGEIDVIIHEPGDPSTEVILEVKTFHGYYAAKQICGSRNAPPRPKTSQLLQCVVYLNEFQNKYPYAKMIYYARDSGSRQEFDIFLKKESPSSTRILVNGAVDHRFTVEDIYERFRELNAYIEEDRVPPNDYELIWDSERVEIGKQIGDVSKTAYEKWKKGKEKVGDWQCRYCGYQDMCWNRQGRPKFN